MNKLTITKMDNCKCLLLNTDKIVHLNTILSNNNINIDQTELNKKICVCDNLLQLIFSPNKSLKLNEVFCQECDSHVQTKYHSEGLDTHLIATSLVAENFGQIFYEKFKTYFDSIYVSNEIFIELCRTVGLFHDIGKPFARNIINEKKKHPIYVGHAQLGTRLIDQINFEKDSFLLEKYKICIEWAINHHMCSCTHMGSIERNLPNIGIHMMMDLNKSIGITETIESNDLKIISFALLSVLSYADHLSRIAEDIEHYNLNDTLKHSFELFTQLIEFDANISINSLLPEFNGKLILLNYGLSGSGKSFCANKIKEKYQDKYDIIHIERDNTLYYVHEKFIGPIGNLSYRQVYDNVYANNKSNVQEQWIQDLCDGFESPQTKNGVIIIIDTVQLLFASQWNMTIESIKNKSEEAYNIYINTPKIGFYSIPIHMFEKLLDVNDKISNNIVSKIGKFSILPDNSLKGLFWPNIYTEKSEKNILDNLAYGSGSFKLISNYINSYFDIQNKKLSNFLLNDNMQNNTQHNLVYLLNNIIEQKQTKNVGEAFFHFMNQYLDKSGGHLRFISHRTEIENKDYQLITFTYDDGLQTFNGTTRDYRGEGVIYSKSENKFYYLRASLPVFPEMASVQKDTNVLPYLINSNLWDELENFANPTYRKLKLQIKPKEINGLYMVPKYDGSLFNLTFIHKLNIVYPMICALIDHNIILSNAKILSSSYYIVNDGIFLMGSKGTILSKNPVNERIHNSILGSYDSIEQFLTIAQNYVKRDDLFGPNIDKQIITLHFEAIDAIPTPELTVYYGKAWCPFFGITIYNEVTNKKEFKLPLNEYKGEWLCVADIYDCNCDWSNVQNAYKTNYNKLLDGDQIVEPEGYVLHLFGSANNNTEWLPIKYKYKIYYTAHKPESKHNLEMALQLSSDSKYELVRQRLAKFREKMSVEQILSNQINTINEINNIIKLSVSKLAETRQLETHAVKIVVKKDWAMYWKQNNNLNLLSVHFNTIKLSLMEHYEQYKNIEVNKSIFPFLMKLFEVYTLDKSIDQLINQTNDQLIKLFEEKFSHV